jgi:mRNA interferase RelE/StbE
LAWQVALAEEAAKELARLDKPVARRIVAFLQERLAALDDPRSIGEVLKGQRLGGLWKYHVGDWRIIASIENGQVRILVVRIGNRRDAFIGSRSERGQTGAGLAPKRLGARRSTSRVRTSSLRAGAARASPASNAAATMRAPLFAPPCSFRRRRPFARVARALAVRLRGVRIGVRAGVSAGRAGLGGRPASRTKHALQQGRHVEVRVEAGEVDAKAEFIDLGGFRIVDGGVAQALDIARDQAKLDAGGEADDQPVAPGIVVDLLGAGAAQAGLAAGLGGLEGFVGEVSHGSASMRRAGRFGGS